MRARRRSMTSLATGSLLVAALLVGCTDAGDPPVEDPEPAPESTPSPPPMGVEMAVIPPARSTTADAALTAFDVDLQVLETANRPEVREIRLLTPDEPVFVRDLAAFAGREGADLTCVVEADGARIVTDLHGLRPAARYCAVVGEVPEEAPADGIDLVVLRSEELGHVIGVAAAGLAGDHVGVAAGGSDLPLDAFVDGLLAGLGETMVTRLEAGEESADDGGNTIDPETRVTQALALGVDTVVVGWGADAPALAAAAQRAGLQVVAPQELVGDGQDRGAAVTWRIRWNRVLQPAVDRAAERSDPAEPSVGFGQGVFEVRLLGGTSALQELVDQAIAEITAGVRDPLAPPEPPDPPPDDDGDDTGEDGDDTGEDGDGTDDDGADPDTDPDPDTDTEGGDDTDGPDQQGDAPDGADPGPDGAADAAARGGSGTAPAAATPG